MHQPVKARQFHIPIPRAPALLRCSCRGILCATVEIWMFGCLGNLHETAGESQKRCVSAACYITFNQTSVSTFITLQIFKFVTKSKDDQARS